MHKAHLRAIAAKASFATAALHFHQWGAEAVESKLGFRPLSRCNKKASKSEKVADPTTKACRRWKQGCSLPSPTTLGLIEDQWPVLAARMRKWPTHPLLRALAADAEDLGVIFPLLAATSPRLLAEFISYMCFGEADEVDLSNLMRVLRQPYLCSAAELTAAIIVIGKVVRKKEGHLCPAIDELLALMLRKVFDEDPELEQAIPELQAAACAQLTPSKREPLVTRAWDHATPMPGICARCLGTRGRWPVRACVESERRFSAFGVVCGWDQAFEGAQINTVRGARRPCAHCVGWGAAARAAGGPHLPTDLPILAPCGRLIALPRAPAGWS
jgi:hypothetical protein